MMYKRHHSLKKTGPVESWTLATPWMKTRPGLDLDLATRSEVGLHKPRSLQAKKWNTLTFGPSFSSWMKAKLCKWNWLLCEDVRLHKAKFFTVAPRKPFLNIVQHRHCYCRLRRNGSLSVRAWTFETYVFKKKQPFCVHRSCALSAVSQGNGSCELCLPDASPVIPPPYLD